MLIFDAHLDLSMNAMEWNRDLRRDVPTLRRREVGMKDKPDRGNATVSFPDMRKGHIGICVGTQIGRYVKESNPLPGWKSPEQAWAQTQGQLAWYLAMEEAGEIKMLRTREEVNAHLKLWQNPQPHTPIGLILSLEGGDSIVSLKHLERAWGYGLRAIGPAHYGPGTYSYGTDSDGPLGQKGKDLIKEIERLGLILDASHLSDTCFWDAMKIFSGKVWASHSNCRSLVNHNRQFNDDQLRELIQRGAVVGAVLDAWMLIPDWVRGQTTPMSSGVTLENVANNIDHVCQLAGNSLHAGIGSDLDGAFGIEQCPGDLDTIADLQKLQPILAKRGYTQKDIENVFSGNYLRFVEQALP